jgi:hypothetical protein
MLPAKPPIASRWWLESQRLKIMRDGNEERFSRLVGQIYDSTLAPSLWPDVLGKIAAFVGGQSAGLISRHSVSKSGNAHYTFGCNSHYLQLYLDRYAKLDPTTTLFFFAPEQVASVADFMPYDEYLETRFHKEWARPQGWVDWGQRGAGKISDELRLHERHSR